jgi:hypothetical protein
LSNAVIALQSSALVLREKLGADGLQCSPSASISSAMANAAASSFGSQVMAKRSRKAVCEHDRFGTAVAAGGEQFERAAVVGLAIAAWFGR